MVDSEDTDSDPDPEQDDDEDEYVPWNVRKDCANEDCPRILEVRWPSDNPDEVEIPCYECGTKTTVRRSDCARLD